MHNRGFSLIECIISILLSSWLCSLIIQHMHIAQYSTHKNYQVISLGYDKAMLSDLLRESIQQAGFTPCRTLTYLSHTQRLQTIKLERTQQPKLHISRMEDNYASILEILSPTHLRITNSSSFLRQDHVLIADCAHAEKNQIIGMRHFSHYTDIHLQNPLQFDYLSPTFIGKWRTETFSLSDDQQGNQTFYYQVNDAHPEVLSKNISAWQIKTSLIPPSQIITILFTMRDNLSWDLQSIIRA